MWIEILILLAIVFEIWQGQNDRKKQEARDARIIELLEDSTAELADIRDEAVKSEDEQP